MLLGVDCGSVSVKLALVSDGKTVAKVYLKNQGLVPTVKQGLAMLDSATIDGVGVTGSGKEFVSAMVGGDVVESEIIAHMVACLKFVPDARTILDIGGEDSKLILIDGGEIRSFQMNRDCGGGTGAMIESIATRLGVKIEDVGGMALQSSNACNLPGKCGIFCQSAVVSELNRGRSCADILMGVCRALVGNYLAVLSKGRKIKPPVVFQGAPAKNEALVKCFRDALRQDIIVPPDCEYMGAIGAAYLAGEQIKGPTAFRGASSIVSAAYRTMTEVCDDCENRCELLSLCMDGQLVGRSGSRCGKHNYASN